MSVCYFLSSLLATEDLPIDFGFIGKDNTSKPEGLREIIKGCKSSYKAF